MYQSIIEHIARHAAKTPDKLCLADGKHEVTYSEMWNCTAAFAQILKNKGIQNDDCIVVECNQSIEYLICEFGVQLLGGVFVPTEKNAALGRIMEIYNDTDAKIFIGDAKVEGIPSMAIKDVWDMVQAEISESATDGGKIVFDMADYKFPASSDVSEILFSTGTTGKSKGIVLTHGNDVAIAENVCDGTKMKPDNIELIPMPLSHSHGLRRTYGNMRNGSSVVLINGVIMLKKVFGLIEQYNVTSIDLSPSMLSVIFKLGKDKIGDYKDQLDYIQLGSAPLPEEDKEHLSRLLPNTRLYNFYGSTEAGCSCILDFNEVQGRPGCIGRPAVNAEFLIVDENRSPMPDATADNPGFLASRGAINMKEYFKAPDLTAEAMPDGDYIYTKDTGYIDADGYVYMLGRKDDVINYGGIKISPEEVESLIIKNDWIEDCAMIPVKDPLTGQAPKLYIQLKAGCEEGTPGGYNLKEFKSFLNDVVDANKMPKIIEVIDEIPRTFNGKIIRKQLIALNK